MSRGANGGFLVCPWSEMLAVKDDNEFLSNDLHHLAVRDEEEEGKEAEYSCVDKVSSTMSCGATDFRIAKMECACPNMVEEMGKAVGEEGNQDKGVGYSCGDKVLSPMDCAKDFRIGQMECSFTKIVEDMSEISKDFRRTLFPLEDKEEEKRGNAEGKEGNQGERGYSCEKKRHDESEAAVAKNTAMTTAAEAELSIGISTTAAHDNITSESNAKEVQIAGRENGYVLVSP